MELSQGTLLKLCKIVKTWWKAGVIVWLVLPPQEPKTLTAFVELHELFAEDPNLRHYSRLCLVQLGTETISSHPLIVLVIPSNVSRQYLFNIKSQKGSLQDSPPILAHLTTQVLCKEKCSQTSQTGYTISPSTYRSWPSYLLCTSIDNRLEMFPLNVFVQSFKQLGNKKHYPV